MKLIFYIIFILYTGQITAQENYRVKKVIFEGNSSIHSSQLLKKMALQPKNGLKRLRDKEAEGVSFSHELLKDDIDELTYFYQYEGFLNVIVRVQELRADDEKETLDILIRIQEGLAFKVDHILFETGDDSLGAELDKATKEALSRFTLKKESRFRDDDFKTDIARLKTELVNHGFAFAKIDYTLDVQKENYTVTILYNITGGPLCYFGDVSISGNANVADKIVRKQISFKTGDVFSRQALDKSQEQIYALGVFQIVSFNATIDRQKNITIPIKVKIKEAPRFTNKIGVGWGKEDRFRAFVDVQWLRFWGGARRLNLYLKHSALEPYHINLRFTQPAFFHPNTSLGINPFIRKQDEPGYKVDRRGANIYIQRQIKRILNTGINYTFEKVNLDTTSIGDAELQPDLTDIYNKSSVTLSISQNNTDDIFSPSRGYNNSMTFKFSGIGPSTYDYTKWMVDLRHYMTVPKGVLAIRTKVGLISSMDAGGFIPVEDRFYSGGSNSIRGWARHELGPKDSEGKPIGGNALLEGSLELRIPVIGSFNTAAFWDFGNVWFENFGDMIGETAHAFGFGIRFATPIGPVRFDLAAPVFHEDKQIRWHLSLGEAF